ncbi:MAG: GNAT family N-acetyltransferase [Rhodobiaceae bacterium]|nr:GNAT family N-acetyltransferase [Rhodobiaceae bacterium]
MGKTTNDAFTIRPLSGSDIETLADWFQDFNDLALFDRTTPIPTAPETVRKMWQSDLDGPEPRTSYWLSAVAPGGALLGVGGIHAINFIHGDGITPLFVAKTARNKGVGLAICVRVMNLAFDSLRLRRLSTFYRADNKASEILLEKLGFQTEGRRREAWYHDGRFSDMVLAGILREDWIARRPLLAEHALDDD